MQTTTENLSGIVASLKSRINEHTVDRLKGIIQAFNDNCGAALSRSGKKAELQDKLRSQLEYWETTQSVASITSARKVLDHIDREGQYNPAEFVKSLSLNPPIMKTAAAAASSRPAPQPGQSSNYSYPSQANGPSTANSSYHATSGTSRSSMNGIPFKSSPFFQVEQQVSHVVHCPESTHMNDRRTVNFEFNLTPEQRVKLAADSRYQLRMYCTSSAFYTAPTTFRPHPQNVDAPIEFPNTTEIRVNSVSLHAQTKGLKKKPGTAPPANLGTSVRTHANAINRIEILYCNNNPTQGQQPNTRKYYVQVNLVKTTSVEDLVERLRKGKFRSKEIVLAGMKQNVSYDDDIVAGPQKIPLKCPISYTRIELPCRSSKCVHASCFDATSWYSMMEITSTWQCPICEHTLNLEDLMIDGYFDDILKRTDEDTEEVYVEADGEWHSLDDKYHSAGWVPPAKPSVKEEARHSSASDTTAKNPATPLPDYSKVKEEGDERETTLKLPGIHMLVKPTEEIVLSDDEDDAVRVRREVLPLSSSPAVNGTGKTGGGDVIDLTLDSEDSDDEDDDAPLAQRITLPPLRGPISSLPTKRKASYEDSESRGATPYYGGSSSKRQRTDDMTLSPPTRTTNGFASYASSSSNYNGSSSSSFANNGRVNLPPIHVPPPHQYGRGGLPANSPNLASFNLPGATPSPPFSATFGGSMTGGSSRMPHSTSSPGGHGLPARPPTWPERAREYRRDGYNDGGRQGW